MSLSSISSGINIPQALVAGIENAALSKGKLKHSALMAASVGVSNLVPAYTGTYSESTEKYLIEPIVAGILYAAGNSFLVAGEKNQGMMKSFVKGFLIGSSSAAVAGSIYGSTMALQYPNSLYSTTAPGLRSDVITTAAVMEGTKVATPAVYTSNVAYPRFAVS